MSLFSQTTRYLLLTAFLVTLLGSVGFYSLIHQKIRHEVDEILISQVEQTQKKLQRQPFVSLADTDDNPHIEPTRQWTGAEFTDVMMPDSVDFRRLVRVRQLQTTIDAAGQRYLVRVYLPYDEFDELARDVSLGVILGFLVLMTLSVLIGIGFSNRLWRPFYATIDQLHQFRLDQSTPLSFPQTQVREFDMLSWSLGELTQKLRQQFTLQKQFTEHASHELQTPLAIAAAELDFLRQSQQLTEDDYGHLQRASDALSRLSQLNRSFLLLTQVENDQFTACEPINLSVLIRQAVSDFEPVFAHRQLSVREIAILPDVWLPMNRQLAGVLTTNLLKNVARHTPLGGSVGITLTKANLIIWNTGEPLPFAESQLFNRFVKDPARPDSIGLGLALVRQICLRYGLLLTYNYDQGQKAHSFRIAFVNGQADNFKFAS